MQASRSRSDKKSLIFPPERLRMWKLEGELLSGIVTLDFLDKVNERGEIPPEVFHRQIKTLLKGIIQSRIELENIGSFDFEAFIAAGNIKRDYINGLNFVQRADGSEDDTGLAEPVSKINYTEMTKLPAKAADFVATSIELLDLLRLEDIATVDRLLPLLDEIQAVFTAIALFGDDFWATKEVSEWIRVLSKRRPGTLLPTELAEKLELQSVRWLNAFRRELKNF